MICPNCGATNEDTNQFCMLCGTSLSDAAAGASETQTRTNQTAFSTKPAGSQAGNKSKDLLKDRITPADGEVSVRTYYCTYYFSRLLGLEAWGYLGITNKRIIFQALGTSNAGSSVIQSELPIADVSGISSYKGTFFSFGHMAIALVAAWIAASIASILVTIGTAFITAIVRSSSGLEVIGWILGIVLYVISTSKARHSIWRPMLAAISVVGFIIGGGISLMSGLASNIFRQNQVENIFASISFFLAFAALIYTLLCIFWYARRPTFSLAISSRGGSDTPINISGASGLGLFNVTAGKALTAEPAVDAELMLQELGAVVLDIQMLGDMGINKWKVL